MNVHCGFASGVILGIDSSELEFNAVDALKYVLPPTVAPVTVAAADEWEQKRDK